MAVVVHVRSPVVSSEAKNRQHTADQVKALCEKRLAPYQQPRHVVFIYSMPRTSLER